jgi:hypothetical protein
MTFLICDAVFMAVLTIVTVGGCSADVGGTSVTPVTEVVPMCTVDARTVHVSPCAPDSRAVNGAIAVCTGADGQPLTECLLPESEFAWHCVAVCPVLVMLPPDPPVGPWSRDDHGICVNWPICPQGIVSPADHALLRVFPETCRSTFSIKITCGACMDTRTPACAPFVGRCMALNWPQVPTDYCQDQVPPPDSFVDGFTICTGPSNGPDGGALANLVCQDDATSALVAGGL